MTKNLNWASIHGKILLFVLFVIVAAASFHGFFSKWGFRDGDWFGPSVMIEETARRPFVYRQLMPEIVRDAVLILPESAKEQLFKLDHFIPKKYIGKEIPGNYILEFYFLYYLTFGFLLISMFLIMNAVHNITKNKIAGVGVAIVFALIFPLLETRGGYYYDFGEILFFSLVLYLVTSPKIPGGGIFIPAAPDYYGYSHI